MPIIVFFISILFVTSPEIVFAQNSAQIRDELVKKQLDCFDSRQARGLGWSDVCYAASETYAAKKRKEEINQALDTATVLPEDHPSLKDEIADLNLQPEPHPESNSDSDQFRRLSAAAVSSANTSEEPVIWGATDLHMKKHTFEFGPEVFYYHYKEPDLTVDIKGPMVGVSGSYEFRPDKGSQIIDDVVNMYKLDARFAYGLLDYHSDPSGSLDNIDDYAIEFRGAAGYDFLLTPGDLITPYVGLGFRYLYDAQGGRTTSTGASSYDRASHYLYAPIGVDFLKQLKNDWQFGANLEGDVFLWGRQDSHLSDASITYGDLENRQKNGYGLRGSLKLIKKAELVNFLFEPFVRYWHIKNSELSTTVGPTGVAVTGFEPDNNTTEFGMKFGIQY